MGTVCGEQLTPYWIIIGSLLASVLVDNILKFLAKRVKNRKQQETMGDDPDQKPKQSIFDRLLTLKNRISMALDLALFIYLCYQVDHSSGNVWHKYQCLGLHLANSRVMVGMEELCVMVVLGMANPMYQDQNKNVELQQSHDVAPNAKPEKKPNPFEGGVYQKSLGVLLLFPWLFTHMLAGFLAYMWVWVGCLLALWILSAIVLRGKKLYTQVNPTLSEVLVTLLGCLYAQSLHTSLIYAYLLYSGNNYIGLIQMDYDSRNTAVYLDKQVGAWTSISLYVKLLV